MGSECTDCTYPQGTYRSEVLAVGGVQVATQHAETQCPGARAHVVEGLLLYGVGVHRLHVSPGHIQLAIAMEADLADSGLAIGYRAAVAAGMAADAAAVDGFPQFALADVARQALRESGHRSPSRKLWSRKTDNSPAPVAKTVSGTPAFWASARKNCWRERL